MMKKTTILLLILLTLIACSTDDVNNLNNTIENVNSANTGDTSGEGNTDTTTTNVDENATNYQLISANNLYQILLDGHNWEQYQDYYSVTDILGNANYGTLKTMLAFSDVDIDPSNSGSMYSRYKLPSSGNSYDLVYDDIYVDNDVLYLKYGLYETTSDNYYRDIYYNSSDNTFFVKYYQENGTNSYSHLYFKVL